jgi:hypothetical protein
LQYSWSRYQDRINRRRPAAENRAAAAQNRINAAHNKNAAATSTGVPATAGTGLGASNFSRQPRRSDRDGISWLALHHGRDNRYSGRKDALAGNSPTRSGQLRSLPFDASGVADLP